MAEALRSLSADLGLTGTHVFFNEGWVPYEERGSYLADADVAVSTHLAHIETHFSFRTRVLDYLWAGLPVLTTEGDSLAELVAAEDLGEVVPYADVEATAAALLRLADPERRRGCAERSRAVAARFRWTAAAEPLVTYCLDPRRAPDRDGGLGPPTESSRLLERAGEVWRDEGPAEVARRGLRRLGRRLRRSR